jgi:integrase/recombinase XerD
MLPACAAEFLQYTARPLEQISSEDILRYEQYLQERPNKKMGGGLSEQMIYHHLYALRLLFIYLEQIQVTPENPMSGLCFPQPQHAARAILGPQEIQSLFNEARTLREKAILHLYYSCGLRRNEAVQLNTGDIHFKSQLLYVRSGKGAKRRVIPLPEKVSEDLKLYKVYERPERVHPARPSEAFILNIVGRRISGDRMNSIVKELVTRTGIEKDISLHSLRHAIATHLLAAGLPLEQVRDFLGHVHLESTQVYTHLDESSLKQLL